jgi:hypothetical protein
VFAIFSPPLPSGLCPFCVILRLKALPWFRLADQIYLIIRIQKKTGGNFLFKFSNGLCKMSFYMHVPLVIDSHVNSLASFFKI